MVGNDSSKALQVSICICILIYVFINIYLITDDLPERQPERCIATKAWQSVLSLLRTYIVAKTFGCSQTPMPALIHSYSYG